LRHYFLEEPAVIIIRIVGDIALLGGELEAARQAALLSLESEGITTVAEATAARNDFVAARQWARNYPGETVAPGAWTRAHAAAAEALSTSPDDIDLMLSLRHG
jgi:hypothetical protein